MSSHSSDVWLKPLEQILPIANSNARFCALLDVVEGDPSDRGHVVDLVARVNAGLSAGHDPRLAADGTGGAYMLSDDKGVVCAIFKPCDEEIYCANNPRGLSSGFTSPNSSQHSSHSDAVDPGRRSRSTTMPSMSELLQMAAHSAPLSFGSAHSGSVGVPTQRIRKGIAPGSAACREHAVFLLDHEHRAGVPLTMLAVVAHEAFFVADEHGARSRKTLVTKIGSLQEFAPHDYVAEDLPMRTIKRFSVDNVHEIAVLDLRTFNTDRNGGNLLVRDRSARTPSSTQTPSLVTTPSVDSDGELEAVALSLSVDSDVTTARERRLMRRTPTASPAKAVDADATPPLLVPVDHGLCLPEDLQESWFEWLTWPQSRVPFSDEMKERIARLSWRNDWDKLRRFGTFSRAVRRVLRTSYLVLQLGAAHDLTPFAIASIACREQLAEMSALEKAAAKACELSGGECDEFVVDNDDDDDEDDYFAVLETQLRELMQNSGSGRQASSDHQHTHGFQFDDL